MDQGRRDMSRSWRTLTTVLGDDPPGSESGQSIVILAAVFMVLLAALALAVDAGFAFVRSSQFSAAIDAAALAGVVDLEPAGSDTLAADGRAEQFLAANGWSPESFSNFVSARSMTDLGIPNYTLTVTWPVELYFARVIGFDHFPLSHSATAAYAIQGEMFTTTAAERGHLRRAIQYVYGPEACTEQGDPVAPLESTVGSPNPHLGRYQARYRYRITASEEYYATTNVLRVELFDPDSYNSRGNSDTVTHSVADGRGATTLDCGGSTGGMGDRCIIYTGENLFATNQNPYWIQRVDETWTPDCRPDYGNQYGNTVTRFELFYLDQDGERRELATYTVDNNRDHLHSDLKWVSPGAPGSPVPSDLGSFEVNLSAIRPSETGLRTLEMDVSVLAGSAKNGWDLWAGPPMGYFVGQGYPALSSDANERNLQLANNPAAYNVRGISVYALGRMPLSNFVNGTEVWLPLAPVEPVLGGSSMYVTVFDFADAEEQDPLNPSPPVSPPPVLNFTIDTVATIDFSIYARIVESPTGGHSGQADDPHQVTCNNSLDCNNRWATPQVAFGIPDVFFFGGTLQAGYDPRGDDHVWSLSLASGRPFLTR
jgi:hypothetical protein